jgi:hypothetical protein
LSTPFSSRVNGWYFLTILPGVELLRVVNFRLSKPHFAGQFYVIKTRRKYTQEFKEEAVKLITEQGYQITEAARNLGVNENMLGRWKREIEGAGEGALKKKALNQRF